MMVTEDRENVNNTSVVDGGVNNETLADIVAALRHNSKGLMFYFRKEENGSTHAMGVDYIELADRIEAATIAATKAVNLTNEKWRRDTGNAAAMRDIVTALAAVILPPRDNAGEDGWLAWVRAMQAKARAALADATTENSSAVGNAAAMRDALKRFLVWAQQDLWENACEGTNHRQLVNAMVDEISAALSAPPRNCDLPLVVDGPANNNADKAWLVFRRHNPEAYFDVPGLLRCIEWLLAPAAEREGGAK